MRSAMKINELTEFRKRLPAEWEDQEAVLMAWPHPDSDWGYIIEEARSQFARLVAAMSEHGERLVILSDNAGDTFDYLKNCVNSDRLSELARSIVEISHNDTWTRDYGPIGIVAEGKNSPLLLDFGFNAWGLKFPANLDNQVNARLKDTAFNAQRYVDCRDFILEGGSIETDGKGTLLTTTECLLNPNRNPTCSREEIEKILTDRLGFDRYLWLNHGHIEGDDTDSHIDTLARFAPGDVIYYSGGESEEMKLMAEELQKFRTRDGQPYHLIELPEPDALHDEKGQRLAATYANFLVTPRAVYVPAYGQPLKDHTASMMLQIAYPDRKIVSVDCTTLIKQGGSLHCSTMQLLPGTIK